MAQDNVSLDAEELRRLRGAVEGANIRVKLYADQVSELAADNAELQERLIATQNQMRIMRHSLVWRAGAVFRLTKRQVGVVVRNLIGMVTR